MSAATTGILIERSSVAKEEPTLCYVIKAATKIPKGTVAMRVSGNTYAEPYVGNTNNAIVLGVAERDYDNTSGVAAYTFPNDQPMVFSQGDFKHLKSDGTITYDHVGTLVGLKDNQTIGATIAANDASVRLRAIDARDARGTRYVVEIKNQGPI
jgi:hypothetical protein